MSDINLLAKAAREKKEKFVNARASGAEFDELCKIGNEYINAIAEWHKERYPNKKFKKPSVSYLIRAL